jgi:hypothetical protein
MKGQYLLVSVVAAATALTACGSPAPSAALPNDRWTPGNALPVTPAQVCVPGYASRTRMPLTTWKQVAPQVFRTYGIPWSQHSAYELDHLIPLELGGSNAVDNLWPEPHPRSFVVDAEENRLHDDVCAGQVSLGAAQRQILQEKRTRG